METPKIGLALGGGAARGWAHIGVLKALAEQGLTFDLIAGTSIGSIVGACLAAGRMVELEQFARSIDVGRMLRLTDLKFHGRGLFDGGPIVAEIARQLGIANIEDLDIPFAAVAVDMVTGEEVDFRQGPLMEAIRASISLPGIFSPVHRDNQILVDGGLANPLPVSVVRDMGADIVIAVDIMSDYEGRAAAAGLGDANREETDKQSNAIFDVWAKAVDDMKKSVFTGYSGPNIIETLTASAGITMKSLTRANLKSDPSDIVIVPKIGHITMLEFGRAEEMIVSGYAAGQDAIPAITKMLAGMTSRFEQDDL